MLKGLFLFKVNNQRYKYKLKNIFKIIKINGKIRYKIMNKRQGKDMKKNIKTTLGVIVAFFVLLKLSNIFTGSSNYEYSESTYSNISENVDEESNYSSQDEEIEQQISTEYNEQIEQEENEEIEETEEEYTYSYTMKKIIVKKKLVIQKKKVVLHIQEKQHM